ncbi:MAG: hypothetical protein H0T84_15155 [Tatlockia sp.]|nr:hypothetical protein [Tatlockia sp.]
MKYTRERLLALNTEDIRKSSEPEKIPADLLSKNRYALVFANNKSAGSNNSNNDVKHSDYLEEPRAKL